MTKLTLPDPIATAAAQAEQIKNNRAAYIDGPVKRYFADNHFVDADEALRGIEQFYHDRMQRVPSAATYPESPPWVDHVIAVDRQLQQLTGLSDRDMALYRCLNEYMMYHGLPGTRAAAGEKCRIVYLPQSDRGELHIKNVDDPPTFWRPRPPLQPRPYRREKLIIDGVGSGLHIDDPPDEIFPLPARSMVFQYADDTPAAVEFLTRYRPFWYGQNVVIYDDQKRSVAIEKTSANFIEVFEPGDDAHSHCSAMVTRNPDSPQGRHHRAKRRQFVEQFNLGDDCSENAFWAACDRAEHLLADGIAALGCPAASEKLITLFTTPWPDGLNKTGAKFHPDQSYREYTLYTQLTLHEQRIEMRWQRDEQLEYSAEPQVL